MDVSYPRFQEVMFEVWSAEQQHLYSLSAFRSTASRVPSSVYASGSLGGGAGTSRPFWPLPKVERHLLRRTECTHCEVFRGTNSPNLSQGGDLPSVTDVRRPRLYLLQWLKSDKALMMLFNDGTFQVNEPFKKAHVQVLRNDFYIASSIIEKTLLILTIQRCLISMSTF